MNTATVTLGFRPPRLLPTLLVLLGISLSASSPASPNDYSLMQSGGVIVLAEQRFNPAVQRMLAERTLKALPISNGRLFYIVPVGIDPRHEQAQIQYLEYLLSRRSDEAKK